MNNSSNTLGLRVSEAELNSLQQQMSDIKELDLVEPIRDGGFYVVQDCVIEVPEGHTGPIIEISPRVSGVRVAGNYITTVSKGRSAAAAQPTVINFDAYCTLPPTLLVAGVLFIRWVGRVIWRGRQVSK